MTPEERALMISMGKAIDAVSKSVLEIQKERQTQPSSPIPAISTSPECKVEHEGFSQRFKMEVGFEHGEKWTQDERMEHSVKLLTELEELFKSYGVLKLHGNYSKHGF